ncbi:dihydrofolate synthetase [[Candida] anglica]|uniref:Dihydrofolate synthetase n=1 Tax=[Candida] anglica TaxID=148631 RepID=A0ABP0EBX1_9ASCO
MIDLGLARVASLLSRLGNPQHAYKTVHIAGTNGKGSTIAYLSSIFTRSQIKNGRFTSPHMLFYNDCISINDEVYPLSKFQEVSQLVQNENNSLQLGCTEFELLTATAYKIFELEKVQLAVIEVGLGGRLDATNVLEPPGLLATAITKIGMDHENLLGNTLAEIAFEKAGIMKSGVPCVVDSTNDQQVLEVVEARSKELHSSLHLVNGSKISDTIFNRTPLKGNYQRHNLSIALQVIELVRKHFDIPSEAVNSGVSKTTWQGRLQTIVTSSGKEILLDGAHNESAAIELASYLQSLPGRDEGIVYIVALTRGKSMDNLFKHILTPNDTIILTGFSVPDNMPWISSSTTEDLEIAARNYTKNTFQCSNNIKEVIQQAEKLSNGNNKRIVICGSLYLCADVLRLQAKEWVK